MQNSRLTPALYVIQRFTPDYRAFSRDNVAGYRAFLHSNCC